MIYEILSAEQCAACKGCCFFDKDDAWESPAPLTEKDGLLVCDYLKPDGCSLKSKKPVECAMYPFRVMQLGEHKVIAVCKYCKPVMDLPLSRLLEFIEEKQEQFLSTKIVKEYNNEYVILKIIGENI